MKLKDVLNDKDRLLINNAEDKAKDFNQSGIEVITQYIYTKNYEDSKEGFRAYIKGKGVFYEVNETEDYDDLISFDKEFGRWGKEEQEHAMSYEDSQEWFSNLSGNIIYYDDDCEIQKFTPQIEHDFGKESFVQSIEWLRDNGYIQRGISIGGNVLDLEWKTMGVKLRLVDEISLGLLLKLKDFQAIELDKGELY